MSLSPGLALKLIKGNETRKMICPPRDIAVLKEHISTLFGIGDSNLSYVDEEGDTITVATNLELQNAYREANRVQRVSFKLYVESNDLKDVQSQIEHQLQVLAQSVLSFSRQLGDSAIGNSACESLLHEAQQAFESYESCSNPHLKQATKQEKEELKSFIGDIIRSETASHFKVEGSKSPVWNGVECKVCQGEPITGIRYLCSECGDFNCCELCEVLLVHPHPMIKMRALPS